ncbi:E3 ubiquitin-protein ligase NHLRC1 [Callorhinchus milii]|uniref:E3 ubiquitin-protein ligase NHLRC1 n=1 Tax=Callorhinchus milii TaxID=7868 RepID=UPI001C3FE634|nr:E3 ubiquitin-protein ligase NHLRC1 [Callorhinchus milii]
MSRKRAPGDASLRMSSGLPSGGSWRLVREIEVNVLECKVCFESYSSGRRPCSLPCGHAVCRLCLAALSRASRRLLQCPFCRKTWAACLAADCLPLLQLAELVEEEKGQEEKEEEEEEDMGSSCSQPPAPPASPAPWPRLSCQAVSGGWGQLLNPTGIALCSRSGRVVVAHDGQKRVRVFDPKKGTCLREFGSKEDIRYPLDVAVTQDGLVLVTDAGDSAVKVFTPHGRLVMTIRESLALPWGVDIGPQDQVAVADAELGSLSLLHIDFRTRTLVRNQRVCSTLRRPREVAICPATGFIHVVEHLRSQPAGSTSPVCLSTFNNQQQLIYQMDSFRLGLLNTPQLWVSGITVDGKGNVLIAEANHKAVVCLGNPQAPQYRTIISQGLSFPLGLVCIGDDTLIVLDGGDYSFKVYRDFYQTKP